jgi:hypothetical protein
MQSIKGIANVFFLMEREGRKLVMGVGKIMMLLVFIIAFCIIMLVVIILLMVLFVVSI